jgi:hypothetical protein
MEEQQNTKAVPLNCAKCNRPILVAWWWRRMIENAEFYPPVCCTACGGHATRIPELNEAN